MPKPPITRLTNLSFDNPSTNKIKGLYIRQLTANEIAAIPAADLVNGLIIYNLTTNQIMVRKNNAWTNVDTGGGGGGGGDVAGPNGATAGDLVVFADDTGKVIADGLTRIIDDGKNYFAGSYAGNLYTTGNLNVAVGGTNLLGITSGSENITIGVGCGVEITTGSNNIFCGAGAGFKTANNIDYNIGIGTDTLAGVIGDANIAIGYKSQISQVVADANISLGAFTMANATTANNCIAIGHHAGDSITNLTNAVAIGAFSDVKTNNAIILGKGCKVGIGTSSPQSMLHLSDEDAFVAPILQIDGMLATAIPMPSTIDTGFFAVATNIVAGTNSPIYSSYGPGHRELITATAAPLVRTIGSTFLNGTTPVVIQTTSVHARSIILINHNFRGAAFVAGNVGIPSIVNIIPETQFSIVSTNPLDTYAVDWMIVNIALDT